LRIKEQEKRLNLNEPDDDDVDIVLVLGVIHNKVLKAGSVLPSVGKWGTES
jgi:hypothetical protein